MPQEAALDFLVGLFNAFDAVDQTCSKTASGGKSAKSKHESSRTIANADRRKIYIRNQSVMFDVAGFTIERRTSNLEQGGTGVFVAAGSVPPHSVVALYPGTLYFNYEPILLQSINNPFIFRCIDGLLIDGNDKGISKYIYRSCFHRDRLGHYQMCDASWLTENPINSLAVGQYVNNQSRLNSANVAYQEISLPKDFPFKLRKYVPNIYYSASIENPNEIRLTRLVALVSTRHIKCGEELFSTYFTVVY